jgi:preprotein translocase subunit Sec63
MPRSSPFAAPAPAAAPDAAPDAPRLLLEDISPQELQGKEAAEKKQNLYGDLGLEKTASENEIKKAYRISALKNHPDKGGNIELFKKIGNAYRILSNPVSKKAYDENYKPGIFS